ncbi:MAG: hypothetical protein ACE5ER_09835 [Nitrospinaceae bacterium]
MSLIHKKHLNYLTTVERFFLSLKGAGVALSAQDYHLIQQWESQGVGQDRLCQALDRSVAELHRSPGGGGGRLSLQRLKDLVEADLQSPRP